MLGRERFEVYAIRCSRRGRFVGIEVGGTRAPLRRVAGAHRYTELICWQLADDLKVQIYKVSNRPPIRRDFKYRDQIREAAASATSNISEGFARRTNAEFARFLDIARASLTEIQNHMKDGVDRGYLDEDESKRLTILAKRSCGAVAALQRYLRGGKN